MREIKRPETTGPALLSAGPARRNNTKGNFCQIRKGGEKYGVE
jgi:hypothetical protein